MRNGALQAFSIQAGHEPGVCGQDDPVRNPVVALVVAGGSGAIGHPGHPACGRAAAGTEVWMFGGAMAASFRPPYSTFYRPLAALKVFVR
jgi:hypothetical protein